MTVSNFLIGPINDGLRKDSKAAFNPNDSFEELTNAYQWRGRVIKRSGYTKLGRLANGTPVMGLRTKEGFGIGLQTLVAFDTTAAYQWNGSAFVSLPSVMPVLWNGTNYQFFFTTNYAGAFWATNSKPGLNGYTVTLFAGSAGTGPWTTTVTATGHTFVVGDQIYFINITGPAALNNLRTGTVIAPVVAGVSFTLSTSTGGSFTDGAATSGMALSTTRTVTGQDGIRYYGTLNNGTGWANYNPPIDPNNALAGALMIFPYRGYLVFLNTTEGNDQGTFNYPNRARWTQIGTPFYSLPTPQNPNIQGFDPLTMRDDLFGRGGANDAPTSESIVTAEFIRDILVVKFTRSTWRLRFVNNSQNPFVWERVNRELGSDCTFSAIPFDKGLMSIGNRGIIISDGNDTVRFDEKIPDDIFDIRQANFGLQRVYGIRTFRTKLNYWTFPSADNPNGIYPDKVLVFNYDTKNWSFFDDCFTCFGYYYKTGMPLTWGDLPEAWSTYTNISWNSGVSQTGFENIVAGNQQGYVLLLEQTNGQNDPCLSISAISNGPPSVFTSADNNLPDGTWVKLSGITVTTSDDGVSLNGRNFKLANPAQNASTFNLTEFKPINAGNASGLVFNYIISYQSILPGSFQINIGSLVYFDTNLDGNLYEASTPLSASGFVNYSTGFLVINFNSSISSTPVIIRLVTLDPLQGFDEPVVTTGTYGGGGEIAKISNIDIQTRIFQFFDSDEKARLSKIDFYVDSTTNGQFTCNVFADSSNESVNQPLSDNRFSNIVLTSRNPYQVEQGDETIFRLFCDSVAQTLQLQFTYSDYQMAVDAITQEDIQIVSLMITMRKASRLI